MNNPANILSIPSAQRLIPSAPFEALISQVGQRVSWMRSHTCPCVFGGAGPQGKLPTPGSAAKGCKQCLGVGTYWDQPSMPFIAWISYMHLSTAPDEPGVDMDPKFGLLNRGDPTVTIPHSNPNLDPADPAQPTAVWNNGSVNDIFVPIDMTARYTAVLQDSGQINLPYQQNLTVAPSGAVTIWDPVAQTIAHVSGYGVSGATVTLPSTYTPGLNYMVEFSCAPIYVAHRHAGGVPHVRPFGGGTITEPRRFRLQVLDFWTRQRGLQNTVPGSNSPQGALIPFATLTGAPIGGGNVP